MQPIMPLNNMEDNKATVSSLPETFDISQNYPNPFNPITRMKYQLPVPSKSYIRIYNTAGQLVRTLIDAHQPAGNYEIQWDGSDDIGQQVGSGIYLYRLTAGNQWIISKKMILTK